MSSDEGEETVTDEVLQQKLLQQLAAYGDSLLDESAHGKISQKRKKPGRPSARDMSLVGSSRRDTKTEKSKTAVIKPGGRSLKKERKKEDIKIRARCAKNDKDDNNAAGNRITNPAQRGEHKYLQDICQKLGLTDETVSKLKPITGVESQNSQSENGCSFLKRKRPPAEVVVFNDRRQRKKANDGDAGTTVMVREDEADFDLGQARYEVRRLGIKGMKEQDKEAAMTNYLLTLGAKAPKKKFYNYKEFQEMKKKELVIENEKREVDRKLGLKVPSNKNRHKKTDKNQVGSVDGQIGKYKSGVQVIKRRDIKKVKRRK